jgi:(p)ppGpp synthase/HD superfamily hydrolase
MSNLQKAIEIAVLAHSKQTRKNGEPYVLHPIRVMLKMNTEEEKIVAVLHDVIEDTKVTYKDLRDAGISERVIAGIRALTKQPGQTYEEYKEGVFASEDAMRVKMADLRHNTDIRRLKGVTEKDIARIAKYQMFYMEIKAKLVDIKSN